MQRHETSKGTVQKMYCLQTRSYVSLYCVNPPLYYSSSILRKKQVT